MRGRWCWSARIIDRVFLDERNGCLPDNEDGMEGGTELYVNS